MRVLCAWFPRLDVELVVRQRPALASRTVVFLQGHGDRAVVSGHSCDASRQGILEGMSAGQARRRSPGAIFLADNSGACLDELERLASVVRTRLTTRVEVGGRDHLFVAIEGDDPEHERALALRVMGIIRAWADRPVRGGLADNRRDALEAAQSSRRGLLICPAGGENDSAAVTSDPRAIISARQAFAVPVQGLAARAAVGTLFHRLEQVAAARGEGFRRVEVSVETSEGTVFARGNAPAPVYTAADAMALVAMQLTPEVLERASAIEVTLSRLAPDVRVKPLGAANFEPEYARAS